MEEVMEGDLLETEEGLIFHVKGLQHPQNGAFAFLRYVPDDSGSRRKNGKNYSKIYSMNKKFDYLEQNYPEYVMFSDRLQRKVQFVKDEDVENVYKPTEKLESLMEKSSLSKMEETVVEFAEALINKGVNRESLGITGSILAGLQKEDSDIDMIGYGEKDGRKIFSVLRKLKEESSKLSSYSSEDSLEMARFRWGESEIPNEYFSKIEKKKVLQGLYQNEDYFFRLVKKDLEKSIEKKSFNRIGKQKITSRVKGDSDSIFTPNHYLVGENTADVEKLTSYRGRFTEQAEEGDRIVAKGRIEKVSTEDKEYKRMILGKPREYLIPINDENEEKLKQYSSIDDF